MSDRVRDMLGWAEDELYRRLEDPDERRKISPNTLIRMVEVLRRSASPDMGNDFKIDKVAVLRRSGLPPERQAELLATMEGVTSEEARSLLGDAE